MENFDENSAKASLFKSLSSIRNQESSRLVSARSSSSLKTSFSSITTSSHKETTGGADEDKKASLNSAAGACATGKSVFAQQSSSIASSTSSTPSTLETTRKTKTLSFLHNEDLFATGTSMTSMGSSSNSLCNMEKLIPTASHLHRSISFQERQCQRTSLTRTESVTEGGKARDLRKMAILSPQQTLFELNEKIKQQQMRMHQQNSDMRMLYDSSDL